MKKDKKNKVIVGVSGGVDSSVAAYLLLKQGYEVKAIHVKSWDSFAANDLEGMSKDCLQGNDYLDAEKVCKFLNIELIKLDLTKQYWNKVFQPAINMLKKGQTPNPDNLCNKFIKFGHLKRYLKTHYPDWNYATGHYANYDHEKNNLIMAKDKFKDQTYFLSKVRTEDFEGVHFPVGNYFKKEVRVIAKKVGLVTHDKKDSTGLCFVGERSYMKFLENYIKKNEGKIVNVLTKKIVGTHNGYEFYTIGQNKNLNLGGQKERMCVVKKDVEDNILFVAPMNHPINFKNRFSIFDVNWIGKIKEDIWEKELHVRIRHQGILHRCYFDKKKGKIKLLKAIRGLAPGQEAVFYFNNVVLGGGTIFNIF